jgi:hypothetical protein
VGPTECGIELTDSIRDRGFADRLDCYLLLKNTLHHTLSSLVLHVSVQDALCDDSLSINIIL